jgi:hypothetical protein
LTKKSLYANYSTVSDIGHHLEKEKEKMRRLIFWQLIISLASCLGAFYILRTWDCWAQSAAGAIFLATLLISIISRWALNLTYGITACAIYIAAGITACAAGTVAFAFGASICGAISLGALADGAIGIALITAICGISFLVLIALFVIMAIKLAFRHGYKLGLDEKTTVSLSMIQFVFILISMMLEVIWRG